MTFRTMGWRIGCVVFVGSLIMTGCSGPPQTTDTSGASGPSDQTNDVSEQRRLALAEVETFNVAQYTTPKPAREVDVRHAVPVRLMQGRADEGVTQTVQGFRVQVYSAQDKQSAEEFRERVRVWWNSVKDDAPGQLFSGQLPIVVEYGQPYYRVRVGAFASREEVDDALAFIRQEFEDAFVALSQVTVTR